MDKYKYIIALQGCDDSTIFGMELTINEFELLQRVAELSQKTSSYSCMPVLVVTEEEDNNV